MTETTSLQEFLATLPTGAVPDALLPDLASVLRASWDDVRGGKKDGMQAYKLEAGRLECVTWAAPNLTFRIDRHGRKMMSQEWTIDTAKMRAFVSRCPTRASARPDVDALASEIAQAMISGATHPHFTRRPDGAVKVKIGSVVPGPAATYVPSEVREEFRTALVAALVGHGWGPIGHPVNWLWGQGRRYHDTTAGD